VVPPVTTLTARFNRCRTLGNGASTNGLIATTLSAGITFTAFFLTTKVFPKRPASRLVSVDVLVSRFVADGQRSCNLLWTSLQIQSLRDQLSLQRINLQGVAARSSALLAENPAWRGRKPHTPELRRTSLLTVDLCRPGIQAVVSRLHLAFIGA
jgi:hypothetical protein